MIDIAVDVAAIVVVVGAASAIVVSVSNINDATAVAVIVFVGTEVITHFLIHVRSDFRAHQRLYVSVARRHSDVGDFDVLQCVLTPADLSWSRSRTRVAGGPRVVDAAARADVYDDTVACGRGKDTRCSCCIS